MPRTKNRIGLSVSLNYPLHAAVETFQDIGYQVTLASLKHLISTGELQTDDRNRTHEKLITGRSLIGYREKLDEQRAAARRNEATEYNVKKDADTRYKDGVSALQLREATASVTSAQIREAALNELVAEKKTPKIARKK